jgi:long-chain acyl-CoA synthetase
MKHPVLYFNDIVRDGTILNERAVRLAGGLRKLGLQEGDVLAVLLRNGLPYADVMLACRIAGIFYCPLNWHFTAEEIGVLLSDSGARVLLGDGDLLDAASTVLPPALIVLAVGTTAVAAHDYESWLADQPGYDGPPVSPRGHMAYTSGTTGKPKGVVRQAIPLEELQARQAKIELVVEEAFGIREGCHALITAPLYHSAPTLYMQNALLRAHTIVLLERFDPEAVLAAIETHRIDAVYLVPIMYVRLLRLPETVRNRYDVSSLRFVASTGAPCAPDVKAAMIAWFGPVIHETYASSEAGMITAIDSQEALARPGSAGRAIQDAEIRIYSEDGALCRTGEVGLIYLRQPAWPDFTYRGNDAARQAIDRDGLIHLGDMGYVDEDGYLYICDRASDMVISGGVNIYPAEIEHRILSFSGVADCAVFGVPDAEYGERLHAVVEPSAGVRLVPAELIDWLKTSLASYKIPRTVEIATLPRDDSGKIAKRRIRAAHWQGRSVKV